MEMANKKQEEMLNAMESSMQRFFHKETEIKMTPKQALEEIGRLEVCFDGIVCSIDGCTKTRGNYDLVNQALTEHEKQTQILEVLKNKKVDIWIVDLSNNVKEYNNSAIYEKLTETEFNLIKEWLK